MKVKMMLSGALLMLAASFSASAQRTPVINSREHHQGARINQGVRSGELTPGEASRLRARERSIRNEKRFAKATGTMTPAERSRLRNRENRTSNAIYNKKHNGRVY